MQTFVEWSQGALLLRRGINYGRSLSKNMEAKCEVLA